MGRSAKTRKRIPKKSTSQPSQASKPQEITRPPTAPTTGQAKRKSNLKTKAAAKSIKNKEAASSGANGDTVLGDVDYVTLMMGGRRKAREETAKMMED